MVTVQLRVKNAKVLYRSVKRMGPDTAPARRLQKVCNSNVLVDCFMTGGLSVDAYQRTLLGIKEEAGT